MYDHRHPNSDANRIIEEEENEYQSFNNQQDYARPSTSDGQVANVIRFKPKNGYYFTGSPNHKLPIVSPQHRPFSEKLLKPSKPALQNNSQNNISKANNNRSIQYGSREIDPEKANRGVSVPGNSIIQQVSPKINERTRPKNIPQDKERLYDEVLKMKTFNHALQEENYKLKTRVSFLEKDAIRYERMIHDASSEMDLPPKTSESHFILSLKNQVKELKNSLFARDEELLEIKRKIKYTKAQELEEQVKTFSEEAARLKAILEQILKEKSQTFVTSGNRDKLQEDYFVQSTQLKVLQKDNEEMAIAIKFLEQQNYDLELKGKEQEKKLKKANSRVKKVMSEKERESIKHKHEAGGSSMLLTPNHSSRRPMMSHDPSTGELEKKKVENTQLLEQLAEKNSQIHVLEKQLKNALKNQEIPIRRNDSEKSTSSKHKQQTVHVQPEPKLIFDTQSSKTITTRTQNEPIIIKNIEPEVVSPKFASEAEQQPSPFKEKEEEEEEEEHLEASQEEEAQPEEPKVVVPKKRVQKVSVDDVRDLGYELNMSVRVGGITFEELDQNIWPEDVLRRNRISIREMIDILTSEPFYMQNQEDIELVARYLVEENKQAYLYFDENIEGDLVIVRSILKKLIGPLPHWNKNESQNLLETISDICIKNQGSLRENLKVLCKSGFLNRRALQEACKLVDIYLTEEQIEFIMTRLFEEENDLQKLSIDKLFMTFNQKPKEVPVTKNPSETPLKLSEASVKQLPKEEPITLSKPSLQEAPRRTTSEFDEKPSATRQSLLKEASPKVREELTLSQPKPSLQLSESNNLTKSVVNQNSPLTKNAPEQIIMPESFRVTKQKEAEPKEEEKPQKMTEVEPELEAEEAEEEEQQEIEENQEEEPEDYKIQLYENNEKVESKAEVLPSDDQRYEEDEPEEVEKEEEEEEERYSEEQHEEEEEQQEQSYKDNEQEQELEDNAIENQEEEEYEIKVPVKKEEKKEEKKEAKMVDVDEEEERVSALDEVEDKLKQGDAHEDDIFKGKPMGKIIGEDDYENDDMEFEEIEDES